MYLKDIPTIRKLLVGERFSINSEQCVANAYSISLPECNLGKISHIQEKLSLVYKYMASSHFPSYSYLSLESRLYLDALVLEFELNVKGVAIGLLVLSLRHLIPNPIQDLKTRKHCNIPCGHS